MEWLLKLIKKFRKLTGKDRASKPVNSGAVVFNDLKIKKLPIIRDYTIRKTIGIDTILRCNGYVHQIKIENARA